MSQLVQNFARGATEQQLLVRRQAIERWRQPRQRDDHGAAMASRTAEEVGEQRVADVLHRQSAQRLVRIVRLGFESGQQPIRVRLLPPLQDHELDRWRVAEYTAGNREQLAHPLRNLGDQRKITDRRQREPLDAPVRPHARASSARAS
jgi:hypothetical protein